VQRGSSSTVTATIVVLQAWNVYSYLQESRNCTLKEERSFEFSKPSTSWKIIFQLMTGNVVISKVDAPMYFVLSKAEKHVPYWDLVCTAESTML
jgi:hypothetical protein